MAKLEPRKLMQLAIRIMGESVSEPRMDGKASPKVGAVLWKPDGEIDTACRGELRYGDHAEYTLLERKNRAAKLDGAVLFTTLEPCAPGSRRHPKLGCAERIVLARIKEVYVGVEDPDPTVDRKGIKYLQDSGVSVRMFDRDEQEKILAADPLFFEQARRRAAEAREKKAIGPIVLSRLEEAFDKTVTTDFSSEALERYHKLAKLEEPIGSAAFYRRLAMQGLLREESGDQWIPTGFGLLLFGKEPRLLMPQAGLLGTIHFEDGREELRDFDGPQVLAPGQALQWLRDKLPDPVDRSRAERRPVHKVFFELVREGIANALMHRDYSVEGAKCQLIVTPETVTVKSPGRLLTPITLEQMQSFNAPMLSRNPILHHVFAQMELVEERGLGLKSMRQKASTAGLPLPAYAWEDPYLSLTVYRRSRSVSLALSPELREALGSDGLTGWEFMASKGAASRSELMEHMRVDERKAQRILKKLIDADLVRRVGKGPATRYNIVRK